MGKFKKILKFSDPYPTFWYEISCYIKAVLATLFLIVGLFLIFHPFLSRVSLFGVFETGLTPTGLKILSFFDGIIWPKGYLGFFIWGAVSLLVSSALFWKIKLVRKLAKTLF